jgi:hypothetical protein
MALSRRPHLPYNRAAPAAAIAGVSRLAALDLVRCGLPRRTERARDEFSTKRATRIQRDVKPHAKLIRELRRPSHAARLCLPDARGDVGRPWR